MEGETPPHQPLDEKHYPHLANGNQKMQAWVKSRNCMNPSCKNRQASEVWKGTQRYDKESS